MNGPLAGTRVLELAGIGPGPFAAMVLADLGAEVLRVDRPPSHGAVPRLAVHRGRRSVALDLKAPGGAEVLGRLAEGADALIDVYRPGVLERLGVGPDVLLARNPRLVVGRVTGWGGEGPLSPTAGHDINYIALAGALRHIARAGQPPTPPLGLVGDMAGGGLVLAVGILAALLERATSGRGQVVDAAMVDGASLLMTMFHGLRAIGMWNDEPGTNAGDSGAPWYDVYEAADGEYVAVGALEPQFYAALLDGLGLDPAALPDRADPAGWPDLRARFAARFAARTRAEWAAAFEGTDACVTPVLSMTEAPSHPHAVHRSAFVTVDGTVQPAPAPRFSRTPTARPLPPPAPGEHTRDVLEACGYAPAEVDELLAAGVVSAGG